MTTKTKKQTAKPSKSSKPAKSAPVKEVRTVKDDKGVAHTYPVIGEAKGKGSKGIRFAEPFDLAKLDVTDKRAVEQALERAAAQGDRKMAEAIAAKVKAAASPAPAAKPEAPAAKPKAAPRSVVPSDAKLTALFKAEENPARPGTVAWKVRDLYLRCKTVGEWRERVAAADLDGGYLQNDVRRGLIRIG